MEKSMVWVQNLAKFIAPELLRSISQIFSVDPFELKLERFIGQEEGHHQGHLYDTLPC